MSHPLTTHQRAVNAKAALCSMTQLQYLKVGKNRLTGTIPTGLGQLVKLRVLWLECNQLIGALPSELAQ